MAYVKDTEILNATNGGLDIILYYYPNANKVVHKSARQFRIRETEKTASASLKQLENGVWVVTDFGGDQKSRNGIQICALEENISYGEACELLGARYHIEGAKIQPVKPIITKRALKEDESPGEYDFEVKDFTEEELKILGPRVNVDHVKDFRLVSLKSFTYCKQNEAIVTESTAEYPIFMFDFGTWQKIYQPNSFEKQYRFRYAGKKPERHVFGMDIIEKEFKERKKRQEEEESYDEEEGDKKKKKKYDPRLEAVFIVSGGSDGVNLRSFGKYPIWFNSESEHLDYAEYKQLKKMAKEIYYIADLDSTGVKQAISLGLKFLDIRLLWLPDRLRLYKDKRGNPRKDFKDFVEVYYQHEQKAYLFNNKFNKLIENALPLQFWTEHYANDKINYNISNTRLYHFLQMLGFGRYEKENIKDGYFYIRKEGNIVKVMQPYQISGFVHDFLESRGMHPDLRDYVYRSPTLSEKSLSNLPAIDIDFSNATRDTQYIFFSKKIMKITADSIMLLKHGEIDNFIWEDKVIEHNIREVEEKQFDITQNKDGALDIKVLKNDNMFFNYLINTSRVHWRYELEEYFDERKNESADEYFKKHQFDIAGPNLSSEQIFEQKQHLINKIYSIGYLLHTYKNYDKAWAIYGMDNKLSELGESHGGSGKSLCYSFMNKVIKRRKYLKGREARLTQNEFIYSGVTEDTDYIMIDDATQYLDFNFFYSEITSSMVVNQKNQDPFEIPFEKSPKMVFTSNFPLRNVDHSTYRRILFTVFSDYYHSSSGDDEYRQVRKVSDDFGGRNLFTDFTEKDYNDFYNFCAQCVQFFLAHDQKVNPPMGNVKKRSLQAQMGEAFMGWADGFFATKTHTEEYKYRDQYFSKEVAFEDFLRVTKSKWSANKFKKSVMDWCELHGWVFNPKEKLTTKDGRIIMKLDNKSQEVFYLQTNGEETMLVQPINNDPNGDDDNISDEDARTVFDL